MALRPPKNLGRIRQLSWMHDSIFPPRGMAMFDEHALGNGDTFGLYWPIGQEDREPLVAEAVHDAFELVPAFSTFSAFLQLTDDRSVDDYVAWPTIQSDRDSPYACFLAARSAVTCGDVEQACVLLQRAIDRLPEYTQALALLSNQCLRLGRQDDACRFAVRAMRSPPSFGRVIDLRRTWNWLSKQTHGPDDLRDDPIWVRRAMLTAPPAGGAKQNDAYPVLVDAADAYAAQGEIIAARTLWQSFGEYMASETVSFRERYDYTEQALFARLIDLESQLPAGGREPTD